MNSCISHASAETVVRHVVVWLTAIGSLGLALGLRAQSDNFNSGILSSNWAYYDVGTLGALYQVPGLGATYSFPSDGTGGHAFRIQCPPDAPYDSAPYSFGPARSVVIRTDVVYTNRFSVGIDVIAWNNTIDQAFGPFWFVQPNPGPGTTSGYVLTYEVVTGYVVRISRSDDEEPTTIAQTSTVVLDPTQRYRFLASSHDGTTFLGQVFNDTDLVNPVAGAIASDTTYQGGLMGLLAYDATSPSVDGADVTLDNFNATAPAAGTMGATVAHLSPGSGEKVTALYPTVSVAILNRDTTVNTGSILLWMDGTQVSASALTIVGSITEANNPSSDQTFPGATVTYAITNLLPWSSVHTNSIAFSDSLGSWTTNTWTWTVAYPYLFASNSLPIGSVSLPGFDARMVQSSAANIGGTGGLDNGIAAAEAVLANPPQYKVDLAATNIVQLVAWDLNATADGAVTNFPGLCIPPTNVNSFAVETLAYLELTAGHYQFHVDSDDAVGIYSGTHLTDTSMVLVQNDGVTHTAFDFVVEADGLYPFHIIYEQGGGAAYLVLNSVNLSDSSQTLVNAAGGVNAFYPLVCKSSTSVSGPYTIDPAANAGNVLTTAAVDCDGSSANAALNLKVTGGTLTVPMSGPAKFYRLDGPRATQITGITQSGSNLVINYQAP